MQSLAVQHRDSIIQRIAQGDKLTEIARSIGLNTHSAISNILADDPEYKTARKTGAYVRMEQRESELESADDSVTVARTRELLSHARWRAEREFPESWGAKQEVTHQIGDTFAALLERVAERKRTAGATAGATVIDVTPQTVINQGVSK